MNAEERRALARHTGDAVVELTRTVEDTGQVMRDRVRQVLGPVGTLPMNVIEAHQRGVFAAVRGAARASAAVAGETLHRTAAPAVPPTTTDPNWAPYVAALGAAFGDRVDPALTTQMGLWRAGAPIAASDLPASPTLLVFVHGLGATELQWSPDYLEVGDHALVRYNSGRPIADNGHDLGELLDHVVTSAQVERLILVGHSMGGLVARSAIAQAPKARWVSLLTDLVTLGAPHSGAPLERAAARALAFGQRFRGSGPIVRLGHFRSRGIKDLRFGAMIHGDWLGDVDSEFSDNTAEIELPGHVRHHAVVALLAPGVGDGMVGRRSAERPGAAVTVIPGNHLSLLKDDRVAALLADLHSRS